MYEKIRKIIKKYTIAISAILVLVIVGFIVVITTSVPPSTFPRDTVVRISKDMTISAAGELLKEKGIIRSVLAYKIYVVLLHDGKGIQAGSYLFGDPQSALRVAYRTAYGFKDIQKIKLTFIEGKNSKELAALIKKNIPDFDVEDFLERAKKYEGYLFPETYFLDPDVRPGEVVDMMRDQFDTAIRPLSDAIATSTRSLKDIITMASIVEEEAGTDTDRRIIAGILWKRLDKGMPLQVDVPFYYFMDKSSSEGITLKDLAMESPYNTYLNKGLPPTPISNPSLGAIKAALYPVNSPYYFYLADKKGVTHYAVTHDGHVINKSTYLY